MSLVSPILAIGGADWNTEYSSGCWSAQSCVISVRINPGDIELTRMLSGASSTASWVIMMRTAPLVAPYMLKRCSGNAMCEAIDAISTKLPPVPCLLMADAASCAQKYVPRTWTVSSSRGRECNTYIDLQESFTFIPLVVEERLVSYNASSSHAVDLAIVKKNSWGTPTNCLCFQSLALPAQNSVSMCPCLSHRFFWMSALQFVTLLTRFIPVVFCLYAKLRNIDLWLIKSVEYGDIAPSFGRSFN